MGNKHIALVGLPGCGKTTLLTALCCQRKGFMMSTTDSPKFIAKNQEMLRSGNWKDWTATDPGTKAAELEFHLSFKKQTVILKSTDYSGEKWEDFINSDNRKDAISKYLKSADAVAICFDLSIDSVENDYKQRYLVSNIENFLKPKFFGRCKFGLVVTKWDTVKDYVQAHGGLEKVLKSKLTPEFIDYLKKKNRIFPVSAAEFEFNPEFQREAPIPGSTATGLGALENWLYGSQTFLKKSKQRSKIVAADIQTWFNGKK